MSGVVSRGNVTITGGGVWVYCLETVDIIDSNLRKLVFCDTLRINIPVSVTKAVLQQLNMIGV